MLLNVGFVFIAHCSCATSVEVELGGGAFKRPFAAVGFLPAKSQ